MGTFRRRFDYRARRAPARGLPPVPVAAAYGSGRYGVDYYDIPPVPIVVNDSGTIVGTDSFAALSNDWPRVNSTPTTASVYNSAATLTFSHTTLSQADRLLIVRVHNRASFGHAPVTSVTWNGNALSYFGRFVNGGTDSSIEFWYLKNPTANTTGNVVITPPSSRSIVAGAVTYANVDQNTTFRRNSVIGAEGGTGTAFSVTDNNSRFGDMIIAGVARNISENISPAGGGEDYDVYNGTNLKGEGISRLGAADGTGEVVGWTVATSEFYTVAEIAIFAPGISVADSGTIAGTEGLSRAFANLATDTGTITGTDSVTVAATRLVTDSGTVTATDTVALTSTVPVADSGPIAGTETRTPGVTLPVVDSGLITGTDDLSISLPKSVSDSGTIVGTEGGLTPTQMPDGTIVNWARNPDGNDPLARGPNGGERWIGTSFGLPNQPNGTYWTVTRDSSITYSGTYSILLTLTAAGAAKYAALGFLYIALDGAAGADQPDEVRNRPVILKTGQVLNFSYWMRLAATYVGGNSSATDIYGITTVSNNADASPLSQVVDGNWQRTAGQAVAATGGGAVVFITIPLTGGTTAANITGLQVRLDNIDLLVDQDLFASQGHISGSLGASYGWFGDPDVSASYLLAATTKTPADSGTISSTDAVVVTQALTVPDTGLIVGTETRATVATLPVPDTGLIVGTDGRTITQSLTVPDTGFIVGTDGRLITVPVSVIDTGIIAGTEAFASTMTLPVADSGFIVGTETRVPTVTMPVADTGTVVGIDFPSLQAPNNVPDTGTITGSESTTIAVAITVADSGFIAGTEALVSTQTLTVADTGLMTGVDTVATPSAITINDSGLITGTDAAAITTSLTLQETGLITGTDGRTITAALSVADSRQITGVDAVSVAQGAQAVPVLDSGTIASADSVFVSLSVARADSGTVTSSDTVLVTVIAQPVFDPGVIQSADAVVVQKALRLDDTATITVAEGIFVQINVVASDSGTVSGSELTATGIVVVCNDTATLSVLHTIYIAKTTGDFRVFTSGDPVMKMQFTSGSVEMVVHFVGKTPKMVTQFTSGVMEEES